MTDAMSIERKQVVQAMQSLGWTATRVKQGKRPAWSFTRPDTGGLWSKIVIPQQRLGWEWMRDHMLTNQEDGADFSDAVQELWEVYYKARFRKTLQEFSA